MQPGSEPDWPFLPSDMVDLVRDTAGIEDREYCRALEGLLLDRSQAAAVDRQVEVRMECLRWQAEVVHRRPCRCVTGNRARRIKKPMLYKREIVPNRDSDEERS